MLTIQPAYAIGAALLVLGLVVLLFVCVLNLRGQLDDATAEIERLSKRLYIVDPRPRSLPFERVVRDNGFAMLPRRGRRHG